MPPFRLRFWNGDVWQRFVRLVPPLLFQPTLLAYCLPAFESLYHGPLRNMMSSMACDTDNSASVLDEVALERPKDKPVQHQSGASDLGEYDPVFTYIKQRSCLELCNVPCIRLLVVHSGQYECVYTSGGAHSVLP